jgi:tRNA threonylcarbamoyladenosine biosynthesis protein TsaB
MTSDLKFLAFDTSTDMMSVALCHGQQTWHHHGLGGANASAQLIPTIHTLLAQAHLQLSDLTALVVGHGPGSFTGLRTACAVAQGLALGAHLKVIAVDSLMAVAEDARLKLQDAAITQPEPLNVGVVMDARMSEVYVGAYQWHVNASRWSPLMSLQVGPPETVAHKLTQLNVPNWVLAGNGFEVYKDRFSLQLFQHAGLSPQPVPCISAVPHALALLRLAPALWQAGEALTPELVQPLYIRDKVAQTTAERAAIKASQAHSSKTAV